MSSLTEIKIPEMVEIWSVQLWKLSSISEINPPCLSFLFITEEDTAWIERLTPPRNRFDLIKIKIVPEMVPKSSRQHARAIANSSSVRAGSLTKHLTFFTVLQNKLWDTPQIFDVLDIVDPINSDEDW
jgi:hypothetical protein